MYNTEKKKRRKKKEKEKATVSTVITFVVASPSSPFSVAHCPFTLPSLNLILIHYSLILLFLTQPSFIHTIPLPLLTLPSPAFLPSCISHLAHIQRTPTLCAVRESLLYRRTGFARDIQLCKLGPYEHDVDTGGVEDLFRGGDGSGKVGVFRESGDEEHEAAGFDLHFSEVGGAGGDTCVFACCLVSIQREMMGKKEK